MNFLPLAGQLQTLKKYKLLLALQLQMRLHFSLYYTQPQVHKPFPGAIRSLTRELSLVYPPDKQFHHSKLYKQGVALIKDMCLTMASRYLYFKVLMSSFHLFKSRFIHLCYSFILPLITTRIQILITRHN